MKYLLILLTILINTSQVRAQAVIENEIATAAAIENSVQRLVAYDAIAQAHGLAPHSEIKKETEGNWRISTDVSPIDDSKTVVCILDADASVQVGYNTIKPSLIVRYKEGGLNAYVNYGTFLGSDNIPVTLRFGKGNAESTTWSISTDNKAAFISGNVAQFVNRLESVDSLIVRLTPYSENPVTISFSPNGIDKVKEAIRNAR
jgi:type VI secretion system protein VasI